VRDNIMIIDKVGNLIENNLIKYNSDDFEKLKEETLKCRRCQLMSECTQVVMGYGDIHNNIMLIGEGPGADEDRVGIPFVGRAGKLLDDIFNAIGIKKEEVYISNIVKCRPPNNRQPSFAEAEACSPILVAEIKLINPKVIVALGSVALKNLIDKNASITKLRGEWIKRGKYFILPTYHPAFLLRNPNMKKQAWHDFLKIKKAIDRIEELKKNGEL
jgi:uracil-DNA glycosylase